MVKRESITDDQWLALKPKSGNSLKEYERWLKLKPLLDESVKDFHGNSEVLESAWGSLLVGMQMGWRVSFIMHNQGTVKKYEKITGAKFRDFCEPETEISKKSLGYKVALKLSSFWKAFRGEESIANRSEFAPYS